MRFFQFRAFSSFPALNQLLSSSNANSAKSTLFNPNGDGMSSQVMTTLQSGNSPSVLMAHFVKVLTKHGQRQDSILASVHARLKSRYGVDHPIHTAIESIKPVLKYQRFKNCRHYVPIVLRPKSSEGIAIRWVIEAAANRKYQSKRNLERGLFDEFDGILQGNSAIYQKRLNFHRNPN